MGKVLVVTGAGGGLGSLAATNEAVNFSEIILIDRNPVKLAAAAAQISSKGQAEAHCIAGDVSSRKQMEDALSPLSKMDGLVNAAGVLGPVEMLGNENWQEWEDAVRVNLVGTASMCSLAIGRLAKSGRGKIVNFAGGGSATPRPYHSAYASSKAGVVRLTEIIASEYPQVDANVIAPGAHKTGIWNTETHDKPPEKWSDEGRFCALVSFLLSEKSDGISGKFIHINDKWEDFTPDITKSDMFSLRRIEPKRS